MGVVGVAGSRPSLGACPSGGAGVAGLGPLLGLVWPDLVARI
jgi:hypothetical protein